jgi:hypothetical protein
METNNDIKITAKNLDWAAKKELCELWKKTPGLSMNGFSKQQGLSEATFYRWCKRFFPKTTNTKKPKKTLNKKTNWIPVNVPQQNNTQADPLKLVMLELLFPNNMKAKINISINEVVNLIQELCYAATVIR